jgi:hypothetical protein
LARSQALRSGFSARNSPASITMRQSLIGVSASVSIPLAKLRAAEQRHRHRFIDQPRRLGRQFVAIQPDKRKWIVGIVDRGRQQRVGALAHQAGIRTVEQDDGAARIRPGQESVDVPSA